MTAQSAPAAEDAALALRAFALWPAGFGGLWLRGPGPARDALVERLGSAVRLKRMPAHIDSERLHGGIDLAASLAAGLSVARSGFLEEARGAVVLAPLAERLQAALEVGGALLLEQQATLGLLQPAAGLGKLLLHGADDLFGRRNGNRTNRHQVDRTDR